MRLLTSFLNLPDELGVRPLKSGPERVDRMRRSPQFRDGRFVNSEPTNAAAPSPGLIRDLFFKDRELRRPSGPVPIATPAEPAAERLGAIWFGHSSVLAEIDGHRVLFDPIWSRRASPAQIIGPKRLHAPPIPFRALPHVDAVVISHDHYDHLDRATIKAICAAQDAPFLVPLGIGAHLERWDVPAERIIELDWDEEADVGGLRFVATAARHFSGRSFTRNDTLWGSWVVAGPVSRVFYAGDSGYFEGYGGIGAAHGPFDLTLLPIGAYSPAWPDVHMTPEEAVEAHINLGGRLLLPVHWATFQLAMHPWAEPAERLSREAEARNVAITVPRPGERVDADAPAPVDDWWLTVRPQLPAAPPLTFTQQGPDLMGR